MADIILFSETFSSGPLVITPTAPCDWWDYSGLYGYGPAPTAYPKSVLYREVDVVGGQLVVTGVDGGSLDWGNAAFGYAVMGGNGAADPGDMVQGPGESSPNRVGPFFMEADITFDPALFDIAEYANLLQVTWVTGAYWDNWTYPVNLTLSPTGDPSSPSTQWELTAIYENNTGPGYDHEEVIHTFSQADLRGKTINVRLEWKPGTLTQIATWPYTIEFDGYFRALFDGVEVGRLDNINLFSRWSYNEWNWMLAGNQGWYGIAGFYDNLKAGIIGAAATWVDVPNFHEEPIDASRFPGGVARCLCDLWTRDSGVMVQARLVSLLSDGTVDAVVGTSVEITATTPTDATFAVALTGNKQHKLQLTSDTPNTDLWCSPDAKVVA
jgi:hypothetical protein